MSNNFIFTTRNLGPNAKGSALTIDELDNTTPVTPGRISTEVEIGEGEFGIEVTPNPASDFAVLNVSGLNNMENYSIKVIDMMGRVISNETVNNTTGSFSQSININKLTAGIYMISVESNGNREVTKLIKK